MSVRALLLVVILPMLIFSLTSAYAETELDKNKKNIFELLISPSDQLLEEIAIPDSAPGRQLDPELASSAISCRSGLNLIFKASDGSPACVKPTTVFKLIERNWMQLKEAFAQTGDSSEPAGIIPSENERAMYYVVRASGGFITQEITTYFNKFTPFTSEEPTIKPDNPVDLKGNFKFALESLPSKDKLEFYKIIGRILLEEPIASEEIDVFVDVVAGDGTTIHTWAYRNCDVTNYYTYLQDTVFFFQFSGGFSSEIRDRIILECGSLHLEVPE